VNQEVNQKAIDPMFEAMCEGLTPEQKADLKRKFAARDELNRLQSRLYLIAWDVSQHFSKQWKGTGFKGQLTAPGKKEALMIKAYLDEFGKVSSEVVISGPGEIENPEEQKKPEQDESVERFWKAMMAKYGNEKEYNKQVINAFKKGDEPEILIVVDKLLTGFDAPRNVVLYIARSLKEHGLLQAIARVNRLHPGKDFGYIIDYYGVVGHLHDAMELYSALGETFDIADLEGTLTNVSEELKQLPSLHDGLWDLFKTLPNKKDEEAFEILLANSDLREDFYTRLSSYCRILKMALSSIQWVTDTPPDKIERYKQDAGFFQKLRASVKIRYAEEIDYRDYEKQIQKMLNTYVQADEVIQVVEPVNIFEREAFQAEVDKARSDRAKADIIANRTKKTITEKMDEDPFFYRKFASLLQQVIDDYKAQRISDAEYLKGVTDVMTQVRDGKTEEGPDILQNRDLSRALFGALKNELGSGSTFARDEPANYGSSKEKSEPLEKVLAEAACAMEDIIRDHAVVRWRENIDAQNRMRNDLDDFLYKLQKQKGVQLSFDQMDAIIEAVIRIAIHRNDDI
jgi:type I restriction enzyme R subunit